MILPAYFGVTGFMNPDQIRQAVGYLPSNAGRRLMVGVLASEKTINGQQNKYPFKYPHRDDIGKIFIDDRRCINLVHYSTDNQANLGEQLLRARELAGPFCQGFQLNVPWPDPSNGFGGFISKAPRSFIVLQVGRRALAAIDYSAEEMVKRLRNYGSLIDNVLIDTSEGNGKPFEPLLVRQYLNAIRLNGLGIGIGVAGGLGPETTGLLKPLSLFRNLCTDAEGRLMDEARGLNMDRVKLYLRRVNHNLV